MVGKYALKIATGSRGEKVGFREITSNDKNDHFLSCILEGVVKQNLKNSKYDVPKAITRELEKTSKGEQRKPVVVLYKGMNNAYV